MPQTAAASDITAPGLLTDRLWSDVSDIYEAILGHPFVTGLTDGTLEPEAFRFYAIQDAHYLREYARALSVLAACSPGEPEIAMFNKHAAGAIEVERSLHEGFFADLGVSAEEVARTPMAPTNRAYTSYLLAVAYGGSFAEGLGVVLPCYWISWEVGKALAQRGSPDPLYRRWIEAYGAEEFGELVRAVLVLADRIGQELSEPELRLARAHFRASARYEWMFWDMGYRQEAWPLE